MTQGDTRLFYTLSHFLNGLFLSANGRSLRHK
jgi:hypothetical protein